MISDTGAGHRSAATAIAKALRIVYEQACASGYLAPDIDIHIVDVFRECAQFPLRKSVALYGPVVRHSPRLYGQLFHITNSAERFDAAKRLCQPFLLQGLRALIERTRPDVIVSVHPLLNHITLQAMGDMGLHVPLITVVTDLVSAHAAWFARGVDACVVPTLATKRLALAHGLPAGRVHVLGMPIDPSFTARANATTAECRRALGLDTDRAVVLLAGGGEGACGLAEAVQELIRQRIRAQLVVVAGRNRQLYAQVDHLRRRTHTPTHIALFGFVQNMPDLMHAADVIVTKAGPGAISEAVACELPIVLTGALPGQEIGNIDFVLQNGLGVLAPTPESVTQHLATMLDTSDWRLDQMRARVRAISTPRATFDVARLIASYAVQASPRL
ncbi:MAG TPA: glycosyltransferase [Ktedonobacterales bacterium]|nr:glycosyltransferase [Ktedonobacterales bacterium]